MNKIQFGDCRETMRQWASEGVKVNTCVTSPPYYGLRDYGTGKWEGGDPNCSHKRDTKRSDTTSTGHANKDLVVGDAIYKSVCPRCGSVRKDRQIGLEETPEDYIKTMVDVFRHVKDILADDGTLWVNIGDSYNSPGPSNHGKSKLVHLGSDETSWKQPATKKIQSLKTKDLIGIPWMLAFALRADGWYLRQDIIWHKPNPMPESVQDRCTKAHEYIFLLSKSQKYYYDIDAIREPHSTAEKDGVTKEMMQKEWIAKRESQGKVQSDQSGKTNQGGTVNRNKNYYGNPDGRNKRSVWTVNTKPYKGSHFATYPPKLIEPCILAGCPKGGVVLDPFMGSGTTAFVALLNDRQYLGCELNPEYAELQKRRIKDAYDMTAQQSLFLVPGQD